MPPMILIDSDVRARHPGVSAASIALSGLAAVANALTPERMDALWARARSVLDQSGMTMESLVEAPTLRPWRDATRLAGLKPANYRSSVEAVTRRVLKEGRMSTPLALVDAYCAISVIHQAPMGAYDAARLPSAPITLRLAKPSTDRFVPLGAPPDQMPLTSQVVVYAAGDTVLCWNFNHRDSAETALVPGTERGVFVSVDDDGRRRSMAALEEMASLVRELGGSADGDVSLAAPIS